MRPAFVLTPQLSRYAGASVLALGLDFAAYLALLASGFPAPLAGAIGYTMGMTLHYSLSSRFVFDRAATAKAEARLFGEFALSGAAGLAVTALVISGATEVLGASAIEAKVLAAASSFLVVFSLRRTVVFAARA
jgi:putative flippase GtrA